MANNYFEFKAFRIEQQKSGMKVCTDSCMFGAWIADILKQGNIASASILDIGTGTGLLSLMIAQKCSARIDAIEIDKASFEEGKENFFNSPWNARLNIINGDVRNFKGKHQYDFIISNPPFYEQDLKSPDKQINRARHNESLVYKDLIIAIKNNIAAEGNFAILLPASRADYFITLAEQNNFFVTEKIIIKQTPTHQPFRNFLLFSTACSESSVKEWCIKDKNEKYTEVFNALLKDYYL